VSHWTHELPDDRLDSITEIWSRFPLPICTACVGPEGIAYTKLTNWRTGKSEPRRVVPGDAEIREWCNEYRADLHEIARANELAKHSIESPALAPAQRSPIPR